MSRNALTYENFFEHFLRAVPSFVPVYEEHMQDNGELLHHVLMGDVARYVGQLYREGYERGNKQKKAVLRDILDILNEAMSSDDEKLQELISVSFLENLGRVDEEYEGLRELFGQALLEELNARESWRPEH